MDAGCGTPGRVCFAAPIRHPHRSARHDDGFALYLNAPRVETEYAVVADKLRVLPGLRSGARFGAGRASKLAMIWPATIQAGRTASAHRQSMPRRLRDSPAAHPYKDHEESSMFHESTLCRTGLAAIAAVLFASSPAFAQGSAPSLDVGTTIPDVAAVKDGLFPEDSCKELEANGFKCMGLKPAVRYSLPASSFKVGSAELPELLKKQLDVFAEVLRGKKGTAGQIRVVGHADASGTPEVNQVLSVKRADAVKDYLVKKGADPSMLTVVGQGSSDPVNPGNPLAPENRRVEIGRQSK